MNKKKRKVYDVLWLCLGFFAVSCSSILNWQESSLPCSQDGNNDCLPGYSCGPRLIDANASACIADGTRFLDEVCAWDAECMNGYLCPTNFCAIPCNLNQVYNGTEACGVSQLCRDYDSNRGKDKILKQVAICAPADSCTPGEACTQSVGQRQEILNGVCVKVSATATACLSGCRYAFEGNMYIDNCSPSVSIPQYCTPIGIPQAQQMVCLQSSPSKQVELGSPCQAVDRPCKTGQACINGTCRLLCQPVRGIPAGNCPLSLGSNVLCRSLTINQSQAIGYCQ
jgi:hypothetical protein